MKDLRMKSYYSLFLTLSTFISLSLMFTMSYLFTIDALPWYFSVMIGSLSIPFTIHNIKAMTYPFYHGIRVTDDNGYLSIETNTTKKIIVRDIVNIQDLQKVIQKEAQT